MSDRLEVFLILMPIFLGSMTLHELAHGYTAYRLGDPTARSLGRLSLNPIVNLDPLGSLMFVLTYWSTSFLFGWAKPVPVDPRYFRHPQRGMALVGAAGPLTNFVLAAGFAAALVHRTYGSLATEVLVYAFYVNVVLGVFNLIPVPPLDGSRIVGGFMRRETWLRWAQLDQYGMIGLIVLLIVFQGQFAQFLGGATRHVASAISVLVGGDPIS